jgi:tetratricopeptide (TPR) repeat protein
MILFGICTSLWSQNDSIFNKANNAYTNGNYQEAVRLYQSILKDDKISSELFFNLGNSYYKLENIPNSIYNYEKALKLDPDNASIKNNLAFAERMKLDQFEILPESEVDQGIENLVTYFSVDTWSKIGLVILFFATGAFFIFLFFRKPLTKRIALSICFVFILCSAGCFSLAQIQLNQIDQNTYAIIFEKEKVLYEEPNTKSSVLFDLHEGTRVRILDEFRSFYKVELPDGTVGWMNTENIKVI